MGSGKPERACGILTMLFLAFALLAVLLAALVYPEVPAIAAWVGAPENLIPLCTVYGEILVIFMPILILTVALQLLLITAERPVLGFATTAVQAAVNNNFYRSAVLPEELSTGQTLTLYDFDLPREENYRCKGQSGKPHKRFCAR